MESDCEVVDAIRLLRLAHELRPEAVPDIRKSLTIFSSRLDSASSWISLKDDHLIES